MMGATGRIRDKLIKTLGLLTSNHVGERDAAGQAAIRLLKSHNLTWSDVIGGVRRLEMPPEIMRAAEEARAARAAQRGVGDDLRLCVRHVEMLRPWEKQFVMSVVLRTKRSPKQNQIIREIAASLRARGYA